MGGRETTGDRAGRDAGSRLWPWIAGIAIAVAMAAPSVGHWLTNHLDQRMVDLQVYRTSGEVLLRDGRIYQFMTEPPQLLPFTYPPFAALIAVPLAWLSWPVAATWVWAGLVYLALTISVCYAFRNLIRSAGRWAPTVAGGLVGACTVLFPVGDQLRFGQVDMFLVALCVADCAAAKPRWPRGMLIGLATAIKLVPGVFLIYFLITGRRREAGNALLTAGAATLGTFALLPRDSVDFWFSAILDNGRVGANNVTSNQSIKGMLLRLYWPDPITTLIWVVLIVAIAYFGFRLARNASWTADRLAVTLGPGAPAVYSAEMAGIAITGLLAVVISPVSWIHHLSWIVLVLGALVDTGQDRRRCWVAGAVFLFYVLPIPYWGSLLSSGHPLFLTIPGRVIQDSYGLGAVALIFLLGIWSVNLLSVNSQALLPDASRDVEEVGTLAG
jgi:alpha-1,2-mannosyltransferase